MDRRCTSLTKGGGRCKLAASRGDKCRFHSGHPDDKAAVHEMAKSGGLAKAYSAVPSTSCIADIIDVDALDLESPAGTRTLLAGALRQLARLPFDVRIANALGQVCTAQTRVVEAADVMARLDALEAAAAPGKRFA